MITLKNGTDIPLYIQIYQQIKEEILSGILPEGSKLPSTRFLSEMLSVGRNTVENAYLQLSSEGYVESKMGSGFIVQNIHGMISYYSDIDTCKETQKDVEDTGYSKNLIELRTEEGNCKKLYLYNFEYGHLSPEHFPLSLWKKVSNKALALLTAEDMTKYCDPKGEIELRNDLADYLRKSRGVSCSADQIILCSGFEYALSLLSQLIRDNFDEIALEEPGYTGAREIFNNNGLKVIPINVEKDGLNIKALEKASARIVYVTPSHQFPTGVVMPIQKRLLLLEWARNNNGIIIEDDYDSELRYNSRPIPSISSVAGNENVVYIGTMSKALSPSLRVNYMVLPQKLLMRYDENFKMYQSPVSLIQQRIIQQFICGGYWESHLRKIGVISKRKHDVLIQTIQEVLDDRVIIHGRNAGLHILLESTRGLSEKEMINKAKEQGVLVYPVSGFWLHSGNYSDNMVLLGFGNITQTEIVPGIRQLGKAWKS
ncbi:MAG: transcriptional regulator with domain and aminotransferase domain [Eubacterium sp.]|nr:transcriptional regulator with domain and aminotransferase domain [Eubacterium sp.]